MRLLYSVDSGIKARVPHYSFLNMIHKVGVDKLGTAPIF